MKQSRFILVSIALVIAMLVAAVHPQPAMAQGSKGCSCPTSHPVVVPAWGGYKCATSNSWFADTTPCQTGGSPVQSAPVAQPAPSSNNSWWGGSPVPTQAPIIPQPVQQAIAAGAVYVVANDCTGIGALDDPVFLLVVAGVSFYCVARWRYTTLPVFSTKAEAYRYLSASDQGGSTKFLNKVEFQFHWDYSGGSCYYYLSWRRAGQREWSGKGGSFPGPCRSDSLVNLLQGLITSACGVIQEMSKYEDQIRLYKDIILDITASFGR